jgi:enoyl-CoA hydratase
MPIKLHIDAETHIAEITLNRPDKMNSLTMDVIRKLFHYLDDIEKDDRVRAVILTGEGRAFCAGSDLNDRLNHTEEGSLPGTDAYLLDVRKSVNKLENLTKPVIAALNGHAIGGGLELALACDIRIASEKAKLGLTEVKVGAIAAAGGTQRLTRLVGLGRALELVLSGELIDGNEARRIGLVNKAVPAEQVMPTARALAGTIAERAPLAARLAKIAVKKGSEMRLEDALDLEAQYAYLLSKTADRAEGMKAFLEKRKPLFQGK